MSESSSAVLHQFINRHKRLFVITGAGISTDSGIPDYRNEEGDWKRKKPIYYQPFITNYRTRQRYWARSFIGWQHFSKAQPNQAHQTLTRLEQLDRIEQLVTQNVDGLHQKAGARRIIDLHGRLDQIICLSCGELEHRRWMQDKLAAMNPEFQPDQATIAPDGDADLETEFEQFQVPDCPICGGILKPDVVFYGENVPKPRVEQAYSSLEKSDALLVIGTSLMVLSAFQFVRDAAKTNKPILAINQGKTRADHIIDIKIEAPIGNTLAQLSLQESCAYRAVN